LLAEEVATLDFSAARWVVLSGCDTGLGSIQVDEGILGLRRAFRTAGAGTVIMSLWPVEDVSADAFMQSLYRARFDELRSTAASMRQAYRDALAATRRARGHTHPLYWAPFIASGDWR
jgi:CHAT domain-containing protein